MKSDSALFVRPKNLASSLRESIRLRLSMTEEREPRLYLLLQLAALWAPQSGASQIPCFLLQTVRTKLFSVRCSSSSAQSQSRWLPALALPPIRDTIDAMCVDDTCHMCRLSNM